jgi:hypothetical protein
MSVIDTLEGARQRLGVAAEATEAELREARDRVRPGAIDTEEAAAIEEAYWLLSDHLGAREDLLHDEQANLGPLEVDGVAGGRGVTLGRLLGLMVSRAALSLPEDPG